MKLRWIDSKSRQTLEVVLNLDAILAQMERNIRAHPESGRRILPATGGALSANPATSPSSARLR